MAELARYEECEVSELEPLDADDNFYQAHLCPDDHYFQKWAERKARGIESPKPERDGSKIGMIGIFCDSYVESRAVKAKVEVYFSPDSSSARVFFRSLGGLRLVDDNGNQVHLGNYCYIIENPDLGRLFQDLCLRHGTEIIY